MVAHNVPVSSVNFFLQSRRVFKAIHQNFNAICNRAHTKIEYPVPLSRIICASITPFLSYIKSMFSSLSSRRYAGDSGRPGRESLHFSKHQVTSVEVLFRRRHVSALVSRLQLLRQQQQLCPWAAYQTVLATAAAKLASFSALPVLVVPPAAADQLHQL